MLHKISTHFRELNKRDFTAPGDCPNLARFTESIAQVFDNQGKEWSKKEGGMGLMRIGEIFGGFLNRKFV
jgi:hypothetical protein